jgi:hypothetical protein
MNKDNNIDKPKNPSIIIIILLVIISNICFFPIWIYGWTYTTFYNSSNQVMLYVLLDLLFYGLWQFIWVYVPLFIKYQKNGEYKPGLFSGVGILISSIIFQPLVGFNIFSEHLETNYAGYAQLQLFRGILTSMSIIAAIVFLYLSKHTSLKKYTVLKHKSIMILSFSSFVLLSGSIYYVSYLNNNGFIIFCFPIIVIIGILIFIYLFSKMVFPLRRI